MRLLPARAADGKGVGRGAAGGSIGTSESLGLDMMGAEACATVKTDVGNVEFKMGWKPELNPPDIGAQGLAKVNWVAVYKI